ncbi:extracellular solute-binding protein [Paeniglutamicibacter sp. NPDC091659]|uniref:ABC transporter substrate-binding protein n=1 Tax=Paeniglutamicibacter sp. NPDC091659 TaxID=3364389 RepID=UPI0037FAE09F
MNKPLVPAAIRSMKTTRRTLLRGVAGLALLASVGGSLAACSQAPTAAAKIGTTTSELATLAKTEGTVQLIAVPADWANYGGQFAAFKEKYGVDTPVATPDASSADEITAVKNLRGQKTQPDVIDIGYSFTKKAGDEKLIAPYKPSNFDAIPADLKDPNGMWVGAYYGVVQVGTNTSVIEAPKTWDDLLDPKYKGKVALPGDPRKGASSIAAVFAASLAHGGSLDNIQPGIDFFEKLAKSGNLVSITSPVSALSTGQAAVVLDWNYNFLGMEEELKKSNITLETKTFADGVFGNYYAQPVVADSPHPNSARLWVDWLTSDEGSELFARGGGIPARYIELKKAGKLSEEALSKLPEAEVIEKIKFPTIEQGETAGKMIVDQWGQKVAAQ